MSTSLHLLVIGHTAPEDPRLQSLHRAGWQVTCGATPDFNAPSPDALWFADVEHEERFGPAADVHWPKALRLLDMPGLQSLAAARQQLLQQRLITGLDSNDFRALFATSGPDLFFKMAPIPLTQREVAAVLRCDLALMTSTAEIDLLVNGFNVPDHLLHLCPPLIDPTDLAQPAFSVRSGFISLADLGQAAELDALTWIRHSLWPMIRRRLPAAQLDIYSRHVPDKARTLDNPEDGLRVREQTEDDLPLLTRARVCLAPLRFGCGLKTALLDSLRAGTPVATTPVGSEALYGALPVATLAEGFADLAARLHEDEQQWHRAQQQAYQLLAHHFDGHRHASALVERIDCAHQDLAQHRLYNFTGAMLRRQRRSR